MLTESLKYMFACVEIGSRVHIAELHATIFFFYSMQNLCTSTITSLLSSLYMKWTQICSAFKLCRRGATIHR